MRQVTVASTFCSFANTDGGAHAVHRSIAAANDHHTFAYLDWPGELFREILRRQVASHQKLCRGVDAGQVFAGDIHGPGNTSALAQIDRCVAFLEEGFDRDVFAQGCVAKELHAQGFQVAELLFNDVFVQFKVGNAVVQDAAGSGPAIENHCLVPGHSYVLRYRKAGGAGADYRYLVAGCSGFRRHGKALRSALIICGESLKAANGYRRIGRHFLNVPNDTRTLAEALLGAYAAAHFRHSAGKAEDVGGLNVVTLLHLPERAGNVVLDGACFYAGRVGALDTAGGFFYSCLGVFETYDNFIPITLTQGWVLLDKVLGRDLQPRFAVDSWSCYFLCHRKTRCAFHSLFRAVLESVQPGRRWLCPFGSWR